MWHKPRLLNALADLLYLVGAAALLGALLIWVVRMPGLPIQQVNFAEPMRHVRQAEVAAVLPAALRGNFFSINLEHVRAALETLPWVRRAEVRRVWPARLQVQIEEHRAAARWDDGRHALQQGPAPSSQMHLELVNTHGERFTALIAEEEAQELPMLYGPNGTAADLLQRLAEMTAILAPLQQRPTQLTLSPRLAWQLKLHNGLRLDIGREQTKAPMALRLRRFVDIYPETVGLQAHPPAVIDLRYPNGFAMRTLAQTEGKQHEQR